MNKIGEIRLKGLPVVQGRGAGVCLFAGNAKVPNADKTISPAEVGSEILKFDEVREKAKTFYRKIREDISESENNAIINIYLQILDDPAFISAINVAVSKKLLELKTAVRAVSADFAGRLVQTASGFFRDRAGDIIDVCEKLLAMLTDRDSAQESERPFILVVRDLFMPSHIISRNKDLLKGILADSVGPTSHAVILARSYGIPLVTQVTGLEQHLTEQANVIVDGYNGDVIVHYSDSAFRNYKKLEEQSKGLKTLSGKWRGPVQTKDGVAVKILANTAFPEDVQQAVRSGADGIGLVRSEYIFFKYNRLPSLREQESHYRDLFKRADGRRLVIRLLDVGGDKTPSYFRIPREYNPFMGWRGIRVLLKKTDLFREHVTAILRAGEGHDYGIIAPMISNIHEWCETRRFIETIAEDCRLPTPDCGVLFEVPLALLSIENFLDKIEFASIGTNDFMQYLSAADRNNPRVNYLYNPVDPAVLKLLRTAIGHVASAGKPISICGEFAGFPLYSVLFLGMGLREFSVNPINIPVIKEVISHTDLRKAETFARKLLRTSDPAFVQKSLISMNNELLPAKWRNYDIFYRAFK